MNMQNEVKQTPMMQQFYRIKQHHPDKILFYRMGDFYEMFGDDAVIAAKVLQIQLTTRNKNKSNSVPLCGVPVHAYDQYLNKLTSAGLKVAVCEQTEDPAKAKGLVRREVVRIVTPGTVIAPDLLDATTNNFISAIWIDHKKKQLGVAFCDLSTGEFEIDDLDISSGIGHLLEMLYLYNPKEILLSDNQGDKEKEMIVDLTAQLKQAMKENFNGASIETIDFFHFDLRNNQRLLQEHFSVGSLSGFGVDGLSAGICSAGAVLNYLRETQKDTLNHIVSIKRIQNNYRMLLDESTILNLELFENSAAMGKKHTLFHLLNHCKTAMGARKLRRWMSAPLFRKEEIVKRHEVVDVFLAEHNQTDKIRTVLTNVGDLERIIARISMPQPLISDLVKLRDSIEPLVQLEDLLSKIENVVVFELVKDFDALNDLFEVLRTYILPEPALKLKMGGYIQAGIHEKLDELRNLTKNGKQLIANLEATEKAKTKITSLKIGYNRVFGYYIEISNASKHLVPENYIRKQTLVNNERYVTEELKELEESILTAEDESKILELEIFEGLKERLLKEIKRIQKTARIIARIDVLSTFAYTAEMNNYARPVMDDNPNVRNIQIKECRHPVIESLNMDEPFIPNDVILSSEKEYIMVITGPNMGGKSTYMRQTAIVALMAQMGSFVSAQEANLPVFDRIFTRVGASDNLTRGQSTFMVEMSEAASILNNATENSLIILDEIGRGTSTFDGISIAWAIIEYIHKLNALTLFATHYHELVLLEEQLEGVCNAKVVVHEEEKRLVFLRKVIAGQTDKSYGIQVARLAGLPAPVIDRAIEVIQKLKIAEQNINRSGISQVEFEIDNQSCHENEQLSFFPPEQTWMKELREFDINNSTPVQAMEFLSKIQKLTI